MLPCQLKQQRAGDGDHPAAYQWRDQSSRGALRARTTIYGNGSLHFAHLRSRDSDTYYCDTFLPSANDTQLHNVIGTDRLASGLRSVNPIDIGP